MGLQGLLCATQAGCFAALASVCAKIATSSEATTLVVGFMIHYVHSITNIDLSVYKAEMAICLRLCGVAGIFLFNALMWVLFTKSMHLCSSTLEATAFNTSSNFIFTAVAGRLVFGEHLGLGWCLGSGLMLLGLLVLHTGSSSSQPAPNSRPQLNDSVDDKEKKS